MWKYDVFRISATTVCNPARAAHTFFLERHHPQDITGILKGTATQGATSFWLEFVMALPACSFSLSDKDFFDNSHCLSKYWPAVLPGTCNSESEYMGLGVTRADACIRHRTQLFWWLKVKYLTEKKGWLFSLRPYPNVIRSFAKVCAFGCRGVFLVFTLYLFVVDCLFLLLKGHTYVHVWKMRKNRFSKCALLGTQRRAGSLHGPFPFSFSWI